jgi:hypothetical protein
MLCRPRDCCPIVRMPRQDMDMKVKHRLPPGHLVGLQQSHPGGLQGFFQGVGAEAEGGKFNSSQAIRRTCAGRCAATTSGSTRAVRTTIITVRSFVLHATERLIGFLLAKPNYPLCCKPPCSTSTQGIMRWSPYNTEKYFIRLLHRTQPTMVLCLSCRVTRAKYRLCRTCCRARPPGSIIWRAPCDTSSGRFLRRYS